MFQISILRLTLFSLLFILHPFDLIEIEFGLPVAFNLDFLTIEAEAGYVIPAYSDPYIPGPKGFIFLMSGFLRLF